MNLIMLGAPGAGKGTQAAILNQKLGIPTISTGNILRAAIKDGTPIGLKAKSYMDNGQLVPDDVIIGIINERLQQDDCKDGYILDGVPRTIGQAEALDQAGIRFHAVIDLEVSDEEILQRMSGRRVCEKCGASYHVVAIPPKVEVRARLEVYHRETEPLKAYYAAKGNLKEVPNQPTVEGTTAKILEALGCGR